MSTDENQLVLERRKKLEALIAAGVEPFGEGFEVDGAIDAVRCRFEEGKSIRAAGRLTAHRDMGKSHFVDISDVTGRMQVYLSAKSFTPEEWNIFQLLDLGDFIGVEGEFFTTKTGELSIRVVKFKLLCKALRPLPDKWHGVQDTEIRYRQRYLDLISNPESKEIFKKRIRIVREIRRYLEERDFVEVETPMMQSVPGGAAAAPFKTHHNALGIDMFLRIAPELYLKRLLVAGFPKVFELNRNFRNEGVSRRHNPEFTMLEAYSAYADFQQMADLVESMVCHLAETICGGLKIEHKNAEGEVTKVIDLTRPWKRMPYRDLVEKAE
ncbi:MAG: amino acid--tRNA ligase-related protein, partial [Chthoniobacterales bacterium]